jgi:hypothetical protein
MKEGKKEHMEAAAKKLLEELGDVDLSEAKSISVMIDMVGQVPKKKKKDEDESDEDESEDSDDDEEDKD